MEYFTITTPKKSCMLNVAKSGTATAFKTQDKLSPSEVEMFNVTIIQNHSSTSVAHVCALKSSPVATACSMLTASWSSVRRHRANEGQISEHRRHGSHILTDALPPQKCPIIQGWIAQRLHHIQFWDWSTAVHASLWQVNVIRQTWPRLACAQMLPNYLSAANLNFQRKCGSARH